MAEQANSLILDRDSVILYTDWISLIKGQGHQEKEGFQNEGAGHLWESPQGGKQ